MAINCWLIATRKIILRRREGWRTDAVARRHCRGRAGSIKRGVTDKNRKVARGEPGPDMDAGDKVVELRGIEPLAYALRTRRSPS